MSTDQVSKENDLSQLSYEEALKQLETIVGEMEGDDLKLEELTTRYEKGMRLRQVCMDKLSEAERKVQELEKSPEGKFTLKPLLVDESSN